MPLHGRKFGRMRRPSARRSPPRWRAIQSAGSCSDQPGCGRDTSSGAWPEPIDALVGVDQQRLDARRAEIDPEIHAVPPCRLAPATARFRRRPRSARAFPPCANPTAKNRQRRNWSTSFFAFRKNSGRKRSFLQATKPQFRARRRSSCDSGLSGRADSRVRPPAPAPVRASPARNAASISVRSITSRCAWLPPKRWAIDRTGRSSATVSA